MSVCSSGVAGAYALMHRRRKPKSRTISMQAAFVLLFGLVLCSPLALIAHGPFGFAILTAWTALSLAIVALAMRAGEAAYVAKFARPLIALAIPPLIWMVLQAVPLPILANSIWKSAAAALNEPLTGRITIDVGATLLAVCRYLAAIGVVFVAACVTIDRRRAELLLVLLAGVATLIATIFVVRYLGEHEAAADDIELSSWFAGITSLGTVLSAALAIHALDQVQSSRGGLAVIKSRLLINGALGLAGLIIGLAALAICTPSQVLIATLCGLAPVAVVAILARSPGVRWERWGITAIAAIIVASITIGRLAQGAGDLTLRVATTPAQSQVSMGRRLIADSGWLGSGAGTYTALVPLYRNLDDPPIVFTAPTAAASMTVEFGRPGLVVALVLAGALAVVLFRRALERGRDAVYSAAGAGCALLGAAQAFCDVSLSGLTVSTMMAATLGLAFGQSLSTARSPK
jgi:hypothetical protein